jgi:hypothetical protein
MSQLRSTFNWTGREVNGCILGEPVVDTKTGEFIWDGAVPTGEINVDGDILQKYKDDVVIKLQAVGEFRGIPSKLVPTEITKEEILKGETLESISVVKGGKEIA